MYENGRFLPVGTTSNFGTKFAQNFMKENNFEKINIKIVLSI